MTFALRALDLDWNLEDMSTDGSADWTGKLTSENRRLTYGTHSITGLFSY